MPSPVDRDRADASPRRTRADHVAQIALVCGIYVAVARVGLAMDAVAGFATLVWPAAGFALAVLLRQGLGLWPGVALGAFLVNLWNGAPALTAVGIAAGNTTAAVVATLAIRRIVGPTCSMARLRDALALVVVGAGASTTISATVGVLSLLGGGVISRAHVGPTWAAWWIGDAVGDLVVAPLLLLPREGLRALGRRSRLEAVALALVILACGWLVFGASWLPPSHDARQAYLLFPVLIWAAARFRESGAAIAIAGLSLLAVTGTALGFGPFVGQTLHDSLTQLQAFMALVAVTGLLLGASKAQIEHSERRAVFLTETSELLASSLDYEATLQRAAALAVPYFADWCLVDVIEDAEVRRVAAAAADPTKLDALTELQANHAPKPDDASPAAVVLRTQRPFLTERFDEATLAQTTRRADHLSVVRRLAPRSAIALPLLARGRIVGAATFAHAESGRHYGRADLALGEEIARRMAVAIDNARLHRATEEARAEAERANRAKDEFLAMLGHELRNPLSPIVTALQLLKLRRAGAGSGRELEVIDRQVHHLVRLVDDLLDVSRITRGKVSLDRARVELADVVAKAVEMAAPLVEQQAHTLVVSVPATGLPVDGDRDRLAQVIANLLTNAAKYTPRGGHIWIRGEREDGQVVVRVRDDGSGIPPELLPRMFDLFVQGERSSERSQGGLGIGLSLVRSLVELHGGSVSARSDGLGEGTEVAVRLPVAAAVAPTSEPPATRPAARAATSRRVLVVDDNRDAAQLLGETLRDVGYDVTIAFDPAEALTAARHAPPEVAILDIGLPVMDGVELAERLRQELPGEPPRFVAVTGYGQPSDRSRTAAAGFAAHLVKPIDVETLVRVIEGTPPPVDGGVR